MTEQNVRDGVVPVSELYRVLVENSSSGLYAFEPGRLLYVNGRFCELFGRPVAQILGRDPLTLVAAADQERARAQIELRFTGGSESARYRFRVARDDAMVYVEACGRVVEYEGRKVIAGTMQDVTAQVQQERELEAAEARYRALMENALDAVLVLGVDGHIIYASAALSGMLSAAADDVIGSQLLDLVHPDDAERVAEALDRAITLSGLSLTVEFRAGCGGGRWSVLECVWTNRLTDPAIGGVVINARDVTSRRRADLRVRESERRLRAVLDGVSDIIVMTTRDRSIRHANAALQRECGYSPEEVMGRDVLDFVHPDDRARIAGLALDGHATGEAPAYIEVRVVRADGSCRIMQLRARMPQADSGAAGTVLIVGRDVTDIRAAEEAARGTELRYRALLQHAPFGIVIGAADEVLEVTPALQELLGHSARELVRKALHSEEDGSDSEAARALFEDLIEGRRDGYELERRISRPDGRSVWARLTVAGVDLDDRRLYLVLVTDITSQRVTEAALRESEARFTQAQKMEALGRLAGGVAHDFNNALTAVKGYAELLLRRFPASDPAHQDASEIVAAADRAASVTAQLLAFSRKQAAEPRLLDLSAAVQEIRTLLARLIGDDVAIILDLRVAAHVLMDAGHLEQVLMNLVVNARDAMSRGGRLTIATSPATSIPADLPAGDYVRLSVRDTGCGMDAATRTRIFEPFFTTKGEQGTGLGLPTVYGIVQQAGGTVTVKSSPGEGSEFSVYLPRQQLDSEPVDTAAAQGGTGRAGTTILLVEDEPSVRSYVARALAGAGWEVLAASEAAEAQRLFARSAAPVSLLLSDVSMPGMTGIELLRQLRQIAPGLPALLMSGYAEAALVSETLRGPHTGFIDKPFALAELLQRVEAMLGGKVVDQARRGGVAHSVVTSPVSSS